MSGETREARESKQESERGAGVSVEAQKGRAKCHVAAAVSCCCLEMALWTTLWMADHVSRMASGGLSASFMQLLMNFLAWYPGAACGLQDEWDKVDVWISVLLCSLGHVACAFAGCCNEGWAAGEWRDNGDIEVRGGQRCSSAVAEVSASVKAVCEALGLKHMCASSHRRCFKTTRP